MTLFCPLEKTKELGAGECSHVQTALSSALSLFSTQEAAIPQTCSPLPTAYCQILPPRAPGTVSPTRRGGAVAGDNLLLSLPPTLSPHLRMAPPCSLCPHLHPWDLHLCSPQKHSEKISLLSYYNCFSWENLTEKESLGAGVPAQQEPFLLERT